MRDHFLFEQAGVKRDGLQGAPGQVEAEACEHPAEGKFDFGFVAVHPRGGEEEGQPDDERDEGADGAVEVILPAQGERGDQDAEAGGRYGGGREQPQQEGAPCP